MHREPAQQEKLNARTNLFKVGSLAKIALSVFISIVLIIYKIPTSTADDTEIFTAGIPPSSSTPNVVFVIDTSGSMANPMQNDTSGRSKIQVVKDTFEQLIFDPNNLAGHNAVNPVTEGMNFALMRFDNGSSTEGNANGGYFLTRMRTLNHGSRAYFWDPINALEAGGYTPLAEAAYEASRYFRGETPLYGATSNPGTNDNSILTGGHYDSPLDDPSNQSQCGINNHLVILTDGMPTRDGDADTQINALANTNNCAFSDSSETDCLPEVARHLHDTDLLGNFPGDQRVMTHTIAFDLSDSNTALNLLAQTAQNGGGIAARANSPAELADAISGILTDLPQTAVSFVRPATSINSANRFVNDNTVYFGLFKPELTPLWPGNLKGYQFDPAGVLKDFYTPPQDALDTEGNLIATAKSKWSNSADGGNVELGGAAEKILAQQANRNIYTQGNDSLVAFTVANENLFPAADFGDNVSNNEKIEIIQWARSRESNPVGDPLHAGPKIVKYGTEVNFGGEYGEVIFLSTNQGFLHAIDANSGNELMSFIPKSLLRNLKTFKDNPSNVKHPYGLDGHISVYVKDVDGDNNIEVADGDMVLVIVGMRRGGNSYYALNVSNLNQPTLQWQITGGQGDFSKLGQTWSNPIISKMNTGSSDSPTVEDVAFIGGGYDTQYDELNNTINNPAGAAIYAVRLSDGTCLWSASNSGTGCEQELTISELTHSIPSHISAFNLVGTEAADRIYSIDITGQVFRIDLNHLNANSEYSPAGRKIADLSGSTRRFYYGVDVAYTNSNGPKLHLSVGSGHRPHPLATDSSDRFYSIWDPYVFDSLPAVTDFPVITSNALTNLNSTATELTGTESGWYFDMQAGEKVLAFASSISNYLFFTTYTPPTTNNSATCEVVYGAGKVYIVNLNDASPLSSDRSYALNSAGIPPEVTFLTLFQPNVEVDPENPLSNSDKKLHLVVGNEKITLPVELDQNLLENLFSDATRSTKTYWR